MIATAPTWAPAPTPPTAARPARFDIYAGIHKGLRQAMAQSLRELGALDPQDADERAAVLDGVDALLALLRGHLEHEDDFIHTAIEARRPGGAAQTAADHLEHQEAIAKLQDETCALRSAPAEQRAELALCLYRHLAVFVAENLLHMQVEESRGNATLWALYSDEELAAIHGRLVASLPPAELATALRWMAVGLSIPELARMLAEMRRDAPAPVFEAFLDIARKPLDERRGAALARALGLPPVPRLVAA